MQPSAIQDCLLGVDHPDVVALLEGSPKTCRRGRGTGDTDAWKADAKRHDEIRANVFDQHGFHIPPLRKLLNSRFATGPYLQTMLPREQDIFLMHKYVASQVLKLNVEQHYFMWDLQYSSAWAKHRKDTACEGLLGCITTGAKFVCTHAAVNRLILGRELLHAQRFGKQIETGTLSNSELTTLAGNTISIPVLVGIFAMLLRCTQLVPTTALSADDGKRQEAAYLAGLKAGELDEGTWVGPSTHDNRTTIVDVLPCKARTGKLKKHGRNGDDNLGGQGEDDLRSAPAPRPEKRPAVQNARKAQKAHRTVQKRPALHAASPAFKKPAQHLGKFARAKPAAAAGAG